MACGVPVVSTTGGALPEVVGNAGIVVPPADSDALAKAMIILTWPELWPQPAIKGCRKILRGKGLLKKLLKPTERL